MNVGERIARVFGAADAEAFLLPGERQIEVFAANATAAENDGIAWVRNPHTVWSKSEAIEVTGAALWHGGHADAAGGLLSLTNQRLLFVAHRANLHTGHYSVFLPTIDRVDAEATSMGEQVVVETGTMSYLFRVGGAPEVVSAILAAKAAVGPDEREAMKQGARAHPDRVGQGLHGFWRPDASALREDELFARIEAAASARHIEEVFGVLNLVDLLHPEWRERVLAAMA